MPSEETVRADWIDIEPVQLPQEIAANLSFTIDVDQEAGALGTYTRVLGLTEAHSTDSAFCIAGVLHDFVDRHEFPADSHLSSWLEFTIRFTHDEQELFDATEGAAQPTRTVLSLWPFRSNTSFNALVEDNHLASAQCVSLVADIILPLDVELSGTSPSASFIHLVAMTASHMIRNSAVAKYEQHQRDYNATRIDQLKEQRRGGNDWSKKRDARRKARGKQVSD